LSIAKEIQQLGNPIPSLIAKMYEKRIRMEVYMFYCLNPNILLKIRLINSTTIDLPYVHKRRKADEYILYIIRKEVCISLKMEKNIL